MEMLSGNSYRARYTSNDLPLNYGYYSQKRKTKGRANSM